MVIKNIRFLFGIPWVTLVFLLSYRAFAAEHRPGLNSDNAIHVLMAYDFKFPDDLYYWGQDRLGSLVPGLAHLILKVVPLSAATAVSWVQYFLLLAGFLVFASLLKSHLLKVVLALAWFLPLQSQTVLTSISQPYGPQMGCIGGAIVIANQLIHQTFTPRIKQLLITLLTLCWFVSIWLSDFSVLLALIFIAVLFGSIYLENAGNSQLKRWQRFNLERSDLINIITTSVIGLAFIRYAKANADSQQSYGTFNSLAEIAEVVTKLGSSAVNTLLFRSNPQLELSDRLNLSMGFHAVLVIVLTIYASYIVFKQVQARNLTLSRWVYFFLISGVVSFGILLTLHWVYRNGISLRYFTSVYVSFWLAALLFADGLSGATAKRLGILLILIALMSSWSLPARTYSFKFPKSKIQQLQVLNTLGKAGFIGEYWSSYVLCSANPGQLNCSSNDRKGQTPCPEQPQPKRRKLRGARCLRCIPKVFSSDTIYLVKNQWFDQFPDEIEQFGQCLTKAGKSRRMAGYTIAPYSISQGGS